MNQTDTQAPEIDTKEHTPPEIKNPEGLLAKNRELLAENRELRTRLAEVQGQLTEAQTALDGAKAEIQHTKGHYAQLRVDHFFQHSAYIAQKLAVPTELVQIAFGQHFHIEGEHIMVERALLGDKAKPWQPGNSDTHAPIDTPALFDVALEALVNATPWRDGILKGTGASGGGAPGSGGSYAIEPPKPEKKPKAQAFGIR